MARHSRYHALCGVVCGGVRKGSRCDDLVHGAVTWPSSAHRLDRHHTYDSKRQSLGVSIDLFRSCVSHQTVLQQLYRRFSEAAAAPRSKQRSLSALPTFECKTRAAAITSQRGSRKAPLPLLIGILSLG